MTILGISGKKQTGKTTVADIIKKVTAGQKTCCSIGFADALKEEVASAMHVPVSYIEQHKEHFRLILQGWGTDFRRNLTSPNYWIEKLIHNLYKYRTGYDIIIVPDVRFVNEANCIHDLGGKLVRVIRAPKEIDSHASEIELDNYEGFDYVIDNGGILDDLQFDVEFMLREFQLLKI